MSTSTVTAATAQERLAASRKAIIRHMTRDSQTHDDEQRDHSYEDGDPHAPRMAGKWGNFKHAIFSWWHHHPARVALDFGRPVVGRYAESHPLKLLGIAAGVGAAVVILRPWRLVSIGGLALAALKSSQLSGIMLSMLSGSSQDYSKGNRDSS